MQNHDILFAPSADAKGIIRFDQHLREAKPHRIPLNGTIRHETGREQRSVLGDHAEISVMRIHSLPRKLNVAFLCGPYLEEIVAVTVFNELRFLFMKEALCNFAKSTKSLLFGLPFHSGMLLKIDADLRARNGTYNIGSAMADGKLYLSTVGEKRFTGYGSGNP